MSKLLLGFAALVLASMATTVSASTLTVLGSDCDPTTPATSLYGSPKLSGACGSSAASRDSSNVNFGAADGQFFSLGLDPNGANIGGAIEFQVSPPISGEVFFFEFTNSSTEWEAAAVIVATLADFSDAITLGIVDNGKGGTEAATSKITFSSSYSYLALADASVSKYGASASADGYDLDAISFAPIPVPTGLPLLSVGLVMLGLLRHRKRS